MSESDEENFCFYGKPLEPYDEDSIPKKRPISVEEQIATDAQGRRRFHGAFTGGFSAGFFNTVGSLEGWLPREYISSRSEKARKKIQKPEDFMDEEDLGEFGIAPQVIKATDEYNTSKKRKKQVFSDGPIPGEPVLHQILTSGNETVGYLLLKNLGIKDKIRQRQEELNVEAKVYSCEMPKSYQISEDIYNNRYKIPEIYREFLETPKDNTFGLGYKGLNKNLFSLFPEQGPSKFTVVDKKNKKVSITGQAFGVGAFENEDDDIYMKEDMSKYDFELGEEKKQAKPAKQTNLIFDMFTSSKAPLLNKSSYPLPKLPYSFTGKHRIRKSRFENIEEEQKESGKLNAAIRAKYLGEETDKQYTESRPAVNSKDTPKSKEEEHKPSTSTETRTSVDLTAIYFSDKFVSSSKDEDVTNILEPVEKMETTHGTEQMRAAAKMKMFGPLTRTTTDFMPCSMLCKRFNVPEPFMDRPEKQRTRTKNLIFEYERHVEEQTQLKPGLTEQKEEPVFKEEPDNNEVIEGVDVIEEPIPEINSTEIIEEVIKDVTDKLDLDQKQDLFRAVFQSSDDESDEETKDNLSDKEESSKTEELKSVVLSDELLPKIKPVKEGILSGVNFHQFKKPTPKEKDPEKSESAEINNDDIPINPDLYGPKMPERISFNKEPVLKVILSSDDEDEWVEKDKSKKKHKKEKKHKKDKHKKHKREKSKNKH